FRISLQPSRLLKSSNVRSWACNAVPIPPSATSTRSPRAVRNPLGSFCRSAMTVLPPCLSAKLRLYLGGRSLTVFLSEPGQERFAVNDIFLRSVGLQGNGRQRAAELQRPLQSQLVVQAGQEASAQRVTDTGGVPLPLLLRRGHVQRRLVLGLHLHALRTQGGHPLADTVQHLGFRPAGALQQQAVLVLVGEQVFRTVDELADL